MNATEVLAALDLPAAARVERRVPKTMLLEHGAPTAADKRRISEGVEQLVWVAALKPTTIGVAVYRDGVREYLEVAVLHATLRVAAKASRLVDLVHRAIPYPTLLVTERGEYLQISLAHKRYSRGEVSKTVLDEAVTEVGWCGVRDDPYLAAFYNAVALTRQPHDTLFGLYQGWIDTVLALRAARRTGVFTTPRSAAHAAARREDLQECERLEADIVRLRVAASKEKQMARLVDLNVELQRVEATMATILARL